MTLRLVVFTITIGFAQPAPAAIDVQLVASGVPFLIGIEHAGDSSGRLFLVSQAGQIYIYNGTTVLSTPFLDVSSLITFNGERGLLGLAFHPGAGPVRESGPHLRASSGGGGTRVVATSTASSKSYLPPGPDPYSLDADIRFGRSLRTADFCLPHERQPSSLQSSTLNIAVGIRGTPTCSRRSAQR